MIIHQEATSELLSFRFLKENKIRLKDKCSVFTRQCTFEPFVSRH